MDKRTAAALAAALLAATAAAAKDVDFDQGVDARPVLAQARAAAKDAPAPAVSAAAAKDDGLWVSFDRSDLARPEAADFPLTAPVLQDSRAEVFRVGDGMLPVLSRFMHERFNRCAGFFALRSKAAAQSAMKLHARQASGPYTLDQRATVKPLVSKVGEAGIRATIDTLASYNNRYYTADTGTQSAQWIAGEWRRLAARIPGASVRLFKHDGWSQPSVILTIPGAETPDEIVVLGGHLDSINVYDGRDARAPGADDNASGIAVLTETIRVLAEGGFRPRRTVEFMGYAAEEVGLRGSQDIADQYQAAGKKVVGVIQYDMSNFAGAGDGIFLLTDNVDPTISEFTGRLIDAYVGVPRGTTECGYACSDHASWNRDGYPAAMAFEATLDTMNQNLHTDHDTLANAGGDARHSVSFAKLAVAFAVEVAKPAGSAATLAAAR